MLKWPAVKSPQENEYDYLSRIHSWALLCFRWHSDQEVWGVPELWPDVNDLIKVSDPHGVVTEDCDGFAQLCRYAIAQSGINSRLVICDSPRGPPGNPGNHCVAETKDGFVFDCNSPVLTNWSNLLGLGYAKKIMGPLCDPNDPYLIADWHKAL